MEKCLPKYFQTKLLVLFSFLIIGLGLIFLWFGLKSTPESTPLPTPSLVQTTPIATSSGTQGLMGERVLVTEVVDGDTIKVFIQGKEKAVRFIGINTPETVDPRRPVGCFGKEASNETKNLLKEKEVVLQKDISDTDKFGRLLRYIFLPLDNGQTLFVNDYLVREGFAKASTFPPDVKFSEQFKRAETEARESKRGLWGRC